MLESNQSPKLRDTLHPTHYHVTLPIQGTIVEAGFLEYQREELPFVLSEELNTGKDGANYWHIKPQNLTRRDKQILGRGYAVEAMQYMSALGTTDLLNCIARDMNNIKDYSHIEDAFWTAIAEFALIGARKTLQPLIDTVNM